VAQSLTYDSFDRTAFYTAANLREQGFNTAEGAREGPRHVVEFDLGGLQTSSSRCGQPPVRSRFGFRLVRRLLGCRPIT
jgi:hypothetical protein